MADKKELMPLRTLTTVPPGGWRLQQKLPDGTTKPFSSMGLVWEFAEQVADFRKGNGLPNATAREVVHEIEEQTCARIHNDPNWCVTQKKTGVRAALAHLSKSAKLVVAGKRILVEWLGDGAKPVPIKQAQNRANVCLKCEHNREGHSFLILTGGTVRAIAEQMQARSQLKLRVDGEDHLRACDICLCPLPLKVHVPLKTILEHTDRETLNSFPEKCWIPTELQTQTV